MNYHAIARNTMSASTEIKCRDAVLYRTHFWDDACAREFFALRDALADRYDLFVTGYVDGPVMQLPPGVQAAMHAGPCVAALGYPGAHALKSAHLSPLKFFRDHADYPIYWLIEYDVRYTGDWAALLSELAASPADLLATVIQRRSENPEWPLWAGLISIPAQLPERCYVKAFTPLMRLSNAAFRAVDAACQGGWTGHYEALWPTAIAAAGLTIEEIGGRGRFTPRQRRGKYYTNNRMHPYLSPGSFVFRPSFLEADIRPQSPALWHPVKSAAMSTPLPPPAPADWRAHRAFRPLRRLLGWLRHYGIITAKPS